MSFCVMIASSAALPVAKMLQKYAFYAKRPKESAKTFGGFTLFHYLCQQVSQ